MTPFIRKLRTLDAKLVKAGFPALSVFWMGTFERFYGRGRRQLVLRVGRRGGKSSSLMRFAVAEALSDRHAIAPGDVGVVAIVSVNRVEAAERIRLVKAILDALQVKHRPIDGGIELVDRPVVFRVFAATIAGTSGFTCICAICDEVAKWKDAESGTNPAREVLASLRPTLAGNPNARIFLSSSPMGTTDAHAVAVDAGETDFQCVATAETWIARPSLSFDECRELEPDEDTFSREYGIRPFDGSTSSLLSDSLIRAVTRMSPLVIPPIRGVQYFAAQDPANRGGNGWTLAIARAVTIGKVTSVSVVRCQEWRASRGGALDSDATLMTIADVLGEYGVSDLWTDQWSYDSLAAIAARYGIRLRQEAATQTSKVQLFDALKRHIVDRTIDLPNDGAVRADLLGVRKWISRNGAFSIELERSGGRHSDYAPSIALVVEKAARRGRKARPTATQGGFTVRGIGSFEENYGVSSSRYIEGLSLDGESNTLSPAHLDFLRSHGGPRH